MKHLIIKGSDLINLNTDSIKNFEQKKVNMDLCYLFFENGKSEIVHSTNTHEEYLDFDWEKIFVDNPSLKNKICGLINIYDVKNKNKFIGSITLRTIYKLLDEKGINDTELIDKINTLFLNNDGLKLSELLSSSSIKIF